MEFIPTLLTCVIFFGQSNIPTLYRYIDNLQNEATDYKNRIDSIKALGSVVPKGEIVLSADIRDANKIRAYGSRGVYVSWKEGGITLLDGRGGIEWFTRIKNTQALLDKKDFQVVQEFMKENNIHYFFYSDNFKFKNSDELKKRTIMRVGSYALAHI